jgi:Zn-dependent peptidase ImmA (M78 family)
VPFGYMFLSNPPVEKIPIPFFRSAQKASTDKVSLNVYHTIQIIQNRQEWLTDYLKELDFPVLDFVGKYTVNSNYKTIVNDIRETLQIEPNWASRLQSRDIALNYLTEKIEETGIIVTFNGIVGANTHRPIDVEECRGFTLVNKQVPFMFINAADAKAAQLFTFMHELAHIWLGESAGFDNKDLLPANNPIEILCDKIAAELLVPEDSFQEEWRISQNFKDLSNFFKVSQIVIARRALDKNFISRNTFFDFYENYMIDYKKKKVGQKDGGNYYATTRKRVSVRFAGFVDSAVKDDKLLYRDAYRLTGLKGDTYDKFMTEYLYQ